MNKLIFAIFAFFLFGCFHTTNGQSKQSIPGSNADVQQWVKQHFAKGKVPPFSFVYGGKKSNDFIKNWLQRNQTLKKFNLHGRIRKVDWLLNAT